MKNCHANDQLMNKLYFLLIVGCDAAPEAAEQQRRQLGGRRRIEREKLICKSK